ncbi:MAG TPA: tetratricopeptide repeat protein [Vicinamibacterales bacterium]|nr:tetratricopeptide repeat protein [Vicinamibacterales bacterium]
MPSQPPAAAPQVDEHAAVREHLARILASRTFHQGDRLKRFLSFIVSEAIAGHRNELKEYVIGVQVFGKEESFDPRTDPIVRVQARRLRAKLGQYYRDEGRTDELIVDLPKGGYAPVFTRRDGAPVVKRTVAATLVSRNTVAVLPFADHSGAHELGHLCHGVREEIVHRLTRLPALRILAPEVPRGPGDAGDAAMVISGSVRRSGDQLRLTAQLVDGASGCYLWSESIDTPAGDLFGGQERIADAIVRRLDMERTSAHGTRRVTENMAARNLYLQGRYHLNQRTEEGLRRAVDFFEKTLAEDAQNAPAHSGLADAYGLLNHYGMLGPAEAWTKAASFAASAVMLDGDSAEAHTSLAHVKSTQEWDWTGAEREFQRAIALNPRYATAHHWYATSCLMPLARLDEALDELRIAQSIDPVSSIVARDLAVVHFYRRDFEIALEQCDHTIELNPHFAPAYWILGVIQEHRREFDESIAAFQRAIQLAPRASRMHGALGRTFALSGRRKQAVEVLRTLESNARQGYVSPMEFAWIHVALGDTDSGFRWLAKASDERAFDLISMTVDPRFDLIRGDRRFAAIVRQLGIA